MAVWSTSSPSWFNTKLVTESCDCWLYGLLSLPFLSLNIFLGAGRSCQWFMLFDMSCKGPFSEIFTFVLTTSLNLLPYFIFIWFRPLCFLLSFSLDVKYFLHVDSQIPVLFPFVSIVDRAIIWKITKRTGFWYIY